MVLLVGGKDEAVAHLATRQGAVVAHHRVVQPQAVFQLHVLAQQEALGYHAVLQPAALADQAVDDGRAVAYLHAVAHRSAAGHRPRFEPLHQRLAVAIAGPEVGVAHRHARRQADAATSAFVHHLGHDGLRYVEPHLTDVEQRAVAPHVVAAQQAHILHRGAVAEAAVVYTAVVQLFHIAQFHCAAEVVTPHVAQVRVAADTYLAPIVGPVALTLQLRHLVGGQRAKHAELHAQIVGSTEHYTIHTQLDSSADIGFVVVYKSAFSGL